MGCCENKTIQTDFILFPERLMEIKQASFDDISIYTDGDDTQKYSSTSPQQAFSYTNSFNSVELAFLMKSINYKSKEGSLILNLEDNIN